MTFASKHVEKYTYDLYCSIIGSLAGTSYFGPVPGHGIVTHDLDLVRMERKKHEVERSGVIGGDIEAVPASESSDNYVSLKKKQDSENKEGGKI